MNERYLYAIPGSRVFHSVHGTVEADDDSYAHKPTFVCNPKIEINDLMKVKLRSEIQKPNRRCKHCRARVG